MLKAKGKWPLFGSTQQHSQQDNLKDAPLNSLPAIPSPDAHKFGLENFGNTCYANSVLQALYFCPPFRDLLIQSTDASVPILPTLVEPAGNVPVVPSVPTVGLTAPRRKPERKASSTGPEILAPAPLQPAIPTNPPGLFSALRSLFVHISTNPVEKGTVGPKVFIDKLRELNEFFRSTMQQDAHEFLNYLLNRIVEEIEALGAKENPNDSVATFGSHSASRSDPKSTSGGVSNTLVHRLFEGVLTSETRCLTCENVSARDEAFLDLSIDIEQNSSVTACLRQFSASEMLCQKNKFFCDSCCDLQEAEKRMKIKRLPNVLALHLKRFKYQEDSQRFIKLAYRVAFPFELRLFNTVDETDDADRLYNLYAIVVHIGAGPHHGHYISIIKTMGNWLIFDDETVSPIAEADIPKYFGDNPAGSAYVLYYQAADIDLASIGLRTGEVAESVISSVVTPSLADQSQSHADSALIHSPPPPAPPGLVAAEEGDSSDLSDPPFPVTPSQSSGQSEPIFPVKKLIPDSNTLQPHAVDSPATTPTESVSPKPSKSFLNTLRRSPSTKHGDGGPDPSPISPNQSHEDPPPLPPLHPATQPQSNGKDKGEKVKGKKDGEKEKKSGGWFGKRSTRLTPDKVTEGVPGTPVVTSTPVVAIPAASSSSSNWFRGGNHSPSREKNRRPSEPGSGIAMDLSAFADMSTTRTSTSTAGGGSEQLNGYADNSVGRVESSSPKRASKPLPTLEFPPVRSTSLARTPTSPTSQVLTLPESSPHPSITSPTKLKHNRGPPPPSSPPPRPSTAGGTSSKPSFTPPKDLPPLPPISPGRTLAHHTRKSSADLHRAPIEGGRLSTPIDDYELTFRRPEGIGMSPAANQSVASTTTTSTTASSNLKRATRKLSLTAPFLGMGKKDKKDKERDRESGSQFGLQTK
ncbi:hypothetical protein DL96DRAFT_1489263 [Flagelloscypha sp. PMI_526]|nr:hypothetical protein DL96DRAFT_1489263 [Flagelloscypha sp. PMI_526]